MSKDNKANKGLAVAGLVAAAAAGAIYLYGKDGEKHRQDLRGWMLKTKGEVMDKMAETENITKKQYNQIVDEAVDKYQDAKRARKPQVESLKSQLKAHWGDITAQVKKHAGSAKQEATDAAESVQQKSGTTSDTLKSVIAGAIVGAAREIASEKLSSKEHTTKETIKEVAKSAGKGAMAGAAKEAAKKQVSEDDEE